MKYLIKLSVLAILFLGFSTTSFAQEKVKKVKKLQAEKILPFAAEKVWAIVGEDYGAIAKSHPKIIESNYINGTLKAGEGAERVCYFNENHSQFLKEKMIDYDPANFAFTNTIYQVGKFPLDYELTRGYWKIVPLTHNTSKIVFDGTLRTKPAFMGGMLKKQFTRLIEDYFIAIEHHLATGEDVTKENFKEVKRQYVSR